MVEDPATRLHLAFRLEGLPVEAVTVQQNRFGLLEAHIEGKGPFLLSLEILEASDPEAGYVSQDLRDWIDEVYLKTRCQNPP